MGLKILMLGPYPYHQGKLIGGVEAVVSTLTDSLARSPKIERVVVIDFFRAHQPAKHERISEKLEVFHRPAQARLALPTRGWLDYRKVSRFSRDFQPDVVHAQGVDLAGDLAIRLGMPSVVSVHGMIHIEARLRFSPALPNRWRIRLMDRMVQRILHRATVVISTSSYDSNALQDQIGGQHFLIPNPVDSAFFDSNKGSPSAEPMILFAGMMVPRKNVTGLLRAFVRVRQQVPRAKLVIIGPSPDAEYAHKVRDLTPRLGLQEAVEFRGFLENAELVANLAQSRCVVLFSNEETSPTILAQAMAAGKPIVASRVGGIAELVQDGQGGFLVDAGDEIALSEKLIEILQSDNAAQAMGAYNHRAAVARSRPDMVAEQTIAAYQLASGNNL